MILHSRIGTGPGKTRTGATLAQAEQARTWCAANLPAYTTPELTRALGKLQHHPDASSAGYSQAKRAIQRIEAELATRPALP